MCQKIKVKGFTLLECLVALLVIGTSVSIYQGLSNILITDVRQLSQNDERDWLLFCQQFRKELEGSIFEKIENNKLYVNKDQQLLAYGQSKKDDFRKTNADGRGYQPMLYHLKCSHIYQRGDRVEITVVFQNGLERQFHYVPTKG